MNLTSLWHTVKTGIPLMSDSSRTVSLSNTNENLRIRLFKKRLSLHITEVRQNVAFQHNDMYSIH